MLKSSSVRFLPLLLGCATHLTCVAEEPAVDFDGSISGLIFFVRDVRVENGTPVFQVTFRNIGKEIVSIRYDIPYLEYKVKAWNDAGLPLSAVPPKRPNNEGSIRGFRLRPGDDFSPHPFELPQLRNHLGEKPITVQLLKQIREKNMVLASSPVRVTKNGLHGAMGDPDPVHEDPPIDAAADGAPPPVSPRGLAEENRRVNEENLKTLVVAYRAFWEANRRKPKSVGELYRDGKGVLREIDRYQCPVRPYSETWRSDYGLFVPDYTWEKSILAWDKAFNWPDGGMVVYYSGDVDFIKTDPPVWAEIAQALQERKNPEIIKKHIPDANLEHFADDGP